MDKNKIIFVLAGFCIIFLLGALKSCSDTMTYRNARDKEIAKRLDLEERFDRTSKDKSVNAGILKKLKEELASLKKAREEILKALAEEQKLNKDLRVELDNAAKFKQVLEEKIKNLQPQPAAKEEVSVNPSQ